MNDIQESLFACSPSVLARQRMMLLLHTAHGFVLDAGLAVIGAAVMSSEAHQMVSD
jgi:hypothetical protein